MSRFCPQQPILVLVPAMSHSRARQAVLGTLSPPVSDGSQRYGVAILANDKVLQWLLPFLESYRATNAATDLYLIPFDDNVAATRRAADVYGAIWVDDEMRSLDGLSARLYPFFPRHRRRLRKL